MIAYTTYTWLLLNVTVYMKNLQTDTVDYCLHFKKKKICFKDITAFSFKEYVIDHIRDYFHLRIEVRSSSQVLFPMTLLAIQR